MAYRILDIDTCRDRFESSGLFGANLDILGLEVPILVGRPIRIDVDFLDGKLTVVKRFAGRLCLSGNGVSDGLFGLLHILRESRLLFFRHLLLVKQRELSGIKGKMLLGHLPELFLAKISEGIQKFGNLVFLGSNCRILLRHLPAKRFILLHKRLDLFFDCHCFFYLLSICKDSEKQ